MPNPTCGDPCYYAEFNGPGEFGWCVFNATATSRDATCPDHRAGRIDGRTGKTMEPLKLPEIKGEWL